MNLEDQVMRNGGDVVAALQLFYQAEGGRQGPTPEDAWHCIMLIHDVNLDVRVDLTGIGALVPGQAAIVPIRFLNPALAQQHCAVGVSFVLRELRPVAKGDIRELAFSHRQTDEGRTARVA